MNSDALTIKGAAEYYGVSTNTIRDWIAAGRLSAYRLGPKLLRVDVSDDSRLIRRVPTVGADAL